MSRCACCGLAFDEDNGWQEICSPECLHDAMTCGLKGKKREHAEKQYDSQMADPKFIRTVRLGKGRAIKPKFGTLRTYTYSFDDVETTGKGKNRKTTVVRRTATRTENIGGKIILRPMTAQERDYAASMRGRGSFGENHIPHTMTDYIPSEQGLSRCGEGWFPHD